MNRVIIDADILESARESFKTYKLEAAKIPAREPRGENSGGGKPGNRARTPFRIALFVDVTFEVDSSTLLLLPLPPQKGMSPVYIRLLLSKPLLQADSYKSLHS